MKSTRNKILLQHKPTLRNQIEKPQGDDGAMLRNIQDDNGATSRNSQISDGYDDEDDFED